MSSVAVHNRTSPAGLLTEQLFRTIFNGSNDAIFVIDPVRAVILEANEKASRLLGYSRDELLGLPVSAIHPDDMRQVQAFAQVVLEQGNGWTNELTCVAKSGDRLPSEISASVIDVDDRACLLALVRDVTERRRARERLEAQAATLHDLVEARTVDLRRSEERHRALLAINNAIVASRERQSLFASIAKALEGILRFDRASLTLADPPRRIVTVHALAGTGGAVETVPIGTEIRYEGTRLGEVLVSGRTIAIHDLSGEPPTGPEARLLAHGVRSVILAPLVTQSGMIGTVNVASLTAGQYSDEDCRFVTQIGRQLALAVENMLAFEEITRLKAQLEQENLYLQEEIRTEHHLHEIVGRSPAILRVARAVETVAGTDATVLISGETGTGKELVARALHQLSPRRHKALIKVNCAALPSGLIESELFGHEKGAFTGAVVRKMGRFELADGGTIFLDEIGDLPIDLQAKLLRVLQEGEFERLGGALTIRVYARVIAATNLALEDAVAQGKFRADLYYRLNVFPIRVPALRDRREDIPDLARHLVLKYAAKFGRRIDSIPRSALKQLMTYSWPGNVRELENVIERAAILSRGPVLDLSAEWLTVHSAAPEVPIQTLDEVAHHHILAALERTGWRVSGNRGAAKLLGLKPTTLEARMAKLGIRRPATS